jgi:hypothetical protein
MTYGELVLGILRELIPQTGARDWEDSEFTTGLSQTACGMADTIIAHWNEIMATKTLVQEMDDTPPQICFADVGNDFSPTAANDLRKGTDTECQLSLASVADSAYRQSAKVDLGEHRAQAYMVRAAFELAATPTAGDVISLYWAPSSSSTAATGNAGGVSGSDAAYTGYSSNADDSVEQLVHIGDFICTVQATTTVQVAEVGMFMPSERYGSLVVRNESGAAFHSDDVECHVVFDPIVDEFQN